MFKCENQPVNKIGGRTYCQAEHYVLWNVLDTSSDPTIDLVWHLLFLREEGVKRRMAIDTWMKKVQYDGPWKRGEKTSASTIPPFYNEDRSTYREYNYMDGFAFMDAASRKQSPLQKIDGILSLCWMKSSSTTQRRT